MVKAKEDHIEKLEVIASVILPNVYKQNQNLIQINKQNIEKVKYHNLKNTKNSLLSQTHLFQAGSELAKITERFSLQEVALESQLDHAQTVIENLQSEIESQKATISDLNKDKETLTMKLVDTNTAACELKNEISELKDQQAQIIEETVQVRYQSSTNRLKIFM